MAWVVASANRGKKSKRPKFKDFLLKWGNAESVSNKRQQRGTEAIDDLAD